MLEPSIMQTSNSLVVSKRRTSTDRESEWGICVCVRLFSPRAAVGGNGNQTATQTTVCYY